MFPHVVQAINAPRSPTAYKTWIQLIWFLKSPFAFLKEPSDEPISRMGGPAVMGRVANFARHNRVLCGWMATAKRF